ncbi:conjugal transfer protein TrbH [Rhizobiales bacterium RZME27]|uniref:Conjugal transfer protein TrbH n=1 Tax=Endobacterium cereale TaxID=2663029 RepID=A0A6A8A6M3_9HYPH|nr:conjugal transfer protein TrbH [Endobacterium cereale]MEB2846616.1 conjugal transfer protein TrbH [Endobacterium cereale]MQY46459.1 conjugal transfer protein TrbH [Endobacterium cereale]
MRRLATILLLMTFASGCQTMDDVEAINSGPPVVSGAAAGVIAGDMASRLAEAVPTRSAPSLRMRKDDTEFATALEAALKGWGYKLVTDDSTPSPKPVELSYSLYSFEGQVLARLTTPTTALGRTYNVAADGASPSSPLSIMQPD